MGPNYRLRQFFGSKHSTIYKSCVHWAYLIHSIERRSLDMKSFEKVAKSFLSGRMVGINISIARESTIKADNRRIAVTGKLGILVNIK